MKLTKVGYLTWLKGLGHYKEFSKIPLTDADKRNGYIQQPVYVKDDEAPE